MAISPASPNAAAANSCRTGSKPHPSIRPSRDHQVSNRCLAYTRPGQPRRQRGNDLSAVTGAAHLKHVIIDHAQVIQLGEALAAELEATFGEDLSAPRIRARLVGEVIDVDQRSNPGRLVITWTAHLHDHGR
jgi:hypothetical protein